MRKIFTSLAAAGLLVAGAFGAVTLVGSTAFAQETEDAPALTRHGDLLADALSELVDEDVISQDQADAVQDRIELKAEARRGEFGDLRRPRGHHGPFGEFGLKLPGFDLRGLLDDGVLDADELGELPDDHPLLDPDGPFAGLLDDGELTLEELKSAFESGDFMGDFPRFGEFGLKLPGFDLRGLLDDGVLDADELAELPEDHPLLDPDGPFAGLLDDGELTLEELKSAFESKAFDFRSRGFRGFGPFGSDTPDAASTSA